MPVSNTYFWRNYEVFYDTFPGILVADPLDSELRILDWIFYQVCKNQQKEIDR